MRSTPMLTLMAAALLLAVFPAGAQLALEGPETPTTESRRVMTWDLVSVAPSSLPSVAMEPGAAPAGPGTEPIGVVWALLDAFERRDEQQYVRWLTEDYVFGSDDPAFLRRFPHGCSREDELRFATHLFVGGGRGPDGRALPVATAVRHANGPVTLVALSGGPAQARLVLHDLQVTLELADGTRHELGGTQNVIDLTLTESGWRVRRWIETHGGRGEADALAAALAAPDGAPIDYARLLPSREPRPVGPWAGMSTHIVWRRPSD